MADYVAVAERNPQVEEAVATLRWTGSWYTVFSPPSRSGGNLTPALRKTLTADREPLSPGRPGSGARVAAVCLAADRARVCVDPDYFQADVEQALMQVLGSGMLPNGTEGLFYPDNFTFGQTVYLSPIYAAARSVAGVTRVTATVFQPQGVNTSQYLDAGRDPAGPFQIARLDNDPSFPDHGQLTLIMEGGK